MTSGPPRPELGALLARLGEDGFVVPARSPRVEWFGDDPALARELGDLRILPFQGVDEAFARDEGEGNGTLAWWRDAHRRFFTRACCRLGREPSETMPVVCRRFRLLHTVGAA